MDFSEKLLPDDAQTSRESVGPLSTRLIAAVTTRESVNLTFWLQIDLHMFKTMILTFFDFLQLLSWTFPDLPGVSGTIRNAPKPIRNPDSQLKTWIS